MVLCSGKIYYDLLAEAAKLGDRRPAIVRVEGLYTFPEDSLKAVLARYPAATDVIWAQEEPRNMGAVVLRRAQAGVAAAAGQRLRYSGRPGAGQPGRGLSDRARVEQARIVAEALG